MKITKSQLKQIIKEELSGLLSEDMDEELERALYTALDTHVAGMTAEEALSAALRSKGQAGHLVRDYVSTHGEAGKGKLLAAMKAEIEDDETGLY